MSVDEEEKITQQRWEIAEQAMILRAATDAGRHAKAAIAFSMLESNTCLADGALSEGTDDLTRIALAALKDIALPAHTASLDARSDADVFSAVCAFDAADLAHDQELAASYPVLFDDSVAASQKVTSNARKAAGHALACTTPSTLAGHAARAACVLRSMARINSGEPDQDPEDAFDHLPEGLLLAIISDLAEATGGRSDAALIADCAAFDALEAQVHDVHGDEPEKDAERDRLEDLESLIVSRIVSAEAVTPEGHAARARSLIMWTPHLIGPGSGDTGQRLLHALLRDLIGAAAVQQARAMLHSPEVERAA